MSPITLTPTQAELALRQSALPPLRKLAIEETEVRIVISGSVLSYYHKQLAQETIMPHLGKRELVNQIKVLAARSE